jgi:CDP-diacylglycerol--glycerol-3-phosphate 3-phosphatidyltransferase
MVSDVKSARARQSRGERVWNLPNQITVGRLLISIILFYMLHREMYLWGTFTFLLAAATDWVDGYLARKTGQVTQIGRIIDPFADKIVVCGTFIFLSAVSESEILPWMTVVVVGRELLVTVMRGFLEQHGKDFSANVPGKLKMGFQCASATASLWAASYATSPQDTPAWLATSASWLAWIAVAATVYSGIIYVFAALRLLKQLDVPQ